MLPWNLLSFISCGLNNLALLLLLFLPSNKMNCLKQLFLIISLYEFIGTCHTEFIWIREHLFLFLLSRVPKIDFESRILLYYFQMLTDNFWVCWWNNSPKFSSTQCSFPKQSRFLIFEIATNGCVKKWGRWVLQKTPTEHGQARYFNGQRYRLAITNILRHWN